jgi:hypothetical protein
LLGVFPAALSPDDASVVVSHPGATYGGVVHGGKLAGDRALEALEGLCQEYRRRGLHALIYKSVPHSYHRIPSMDGEYALFRAGARLYRCDLSASIALDRPEPRSERRKRGLKKAAKQGVALAREGEGLLEWYWALLGDILGIQARSQADAQRRGADQMAPG